MKLILTIISALILFSCTDRKPPLGPVAKPTTQYVTLNIRIYSIVPDGFVKRISGNVYFGGQSYFYYTTMRDTFMAAQIVEVTDYNKPTNDLLVRYTNISSPTDPAMEIKVWTE